MRENKWLGATDEELLAAIEQFADAEDQHGSGHLWPGLARALAERFRKLTDADAPAVVTPP